MIHSTDYLCISMHTSLGYSRRNIVYEKIVCANSQCVEKLHKLCTIMARF